MSAARLLPVLSSATSSSVRASMCVRALGAVRNDSPESLLHLDAIPTLLRLLKEYWPDTNSDAKSADEPNKSTIAVDGSGDSDDGHAAAESLEESWVESAAVSRACLDVLSHVLRATGACASFLAHDGSLGVLSEELVIHASASSTRPFDIGLACDIALVSSMLLSHLSDEPPAVDDQPFKRNAHVQFVFNVLVPRLVHSFEFGCAEAPPLELAALQQSGLTCLLLLMQMQIDAQRHAIIEQASTTAEVRDATDLLCSRTLVESLVRVWETSAEVVAAAHWKYCVFFARRSELLASKQANNSASSLDALDNDDSLLRRVLSTLVPLLSLPTAPSALLLQCLATLQALCTRYTHAATMMCVPVTGGDGSSLPDTLSSLVDLLRSFSHEQEIQRATLRLLNTLLVQRSSNSTPPPTTPTAIPLLDINNDNDTDSSDAGAQTIASLHSRLLSLGILPLLLAPFEAASENATAGDTSVASHPVTDTVSDLQCLALYAFSAIFLSGRWLRENATSGEADSLSSSHTGDMLRSCEQLCMSLLRMQTALAVDAASRPGRALRVTSASVAWSRAFASALCVLAASGPAAEHLLAHGTLERVWTCIDTCREYAPLVAPLLVFVLRIGAAAHPSIRSACEQSLPLATVVCESLFDAFAHEASIVEMLADALLLMQGKAPSPIKYRT